MKLECSLNAYAVRHLSQGESRIETSITATDDNPFKSLETLSTTFNNAHLNNQGIAWTRLRDILLELVCLSVR